MNHVPLYPEVPLQIQKPCRKSWDELTGDENKRYCSECCLHVHNAAELTQSEAKALVSGANSRVCMRFQYDSDGAPIFRDSNLAETSSARTSQRRGARIARWALSAAAGLLAACHGSIADPASNDPAVSSSGGESPSKMGEVCSTEIVGDVALPPVQGRELLGQAVVNPNPAPAPAPEAPSQLDDE